MDNLIADLHIHSKYSHDSLMSPEKIVRCAKKAGLNCIAITDHDTLRGGIEGKKAGEKYGVEVLVGSEVKTDCGDIIGLNLSEEIRVTGWQEVISAIRLQSGTVVLPHPYRDHFHVEEIAQSVDFIEIWNGRSTPEQNMAAGDLATRAGKPLMYGSDAHTGSEIGSVKTRIDPISYRCREIIQFRPATEAEIRRSRITSLVKQKKFGTLISQGARRLREKIWRSP
jgi:hypothetical protein